MNERDKERIQKIIDKNDKTEESHPRYRKYGEKDDVQEDDKDN